MTAVPVSQSAEALRQGRLGTPAYPCFERIGAGGGGGYVPGLHRDVILQGLRSQRTLQFGDELHERDGLAVADVEDAIGCGCAFPVGGEAAADPDDGFRDI